MITTTVTAITRADQARYARYHDEPWFCDHCVAAHPDANWNIAECRVLVTDAPKQTTPACAALCREHVTELVERLQAVVDLLDAAEASGWLR